MPTKIPEPTIALSTPEYEISDHTAATKARQLMDKLKEYGTADNWGKNNGAMGFRKDMSNTRRWRAMLKMPLTRDDLYGAWYDRNGHIMPKPDPKRTAQVQLWFLASTKLHPEAINETESALYLSMVALRRRKILHPETVNYHPGTALILLRVTLHAIQRMIQRGFALADDGEISYVQLLDFLMQVWAGADAKYRADGELPAEYRIEYEGAIFVLKARKDMYEEAAMTLVTMLPPKK